MRTIQARRSQIAMEFIMILILVMLITTLLAWTAYYYIVEYSEERNIKRLEELGYSLQNEVILAYNVEPGYSRRITIPSDLDGYPVNISGTSNLIILTYKDSQFLFKIPQVSGNFTHTGTQPNIIRKNLDGTVSIS